MLFRNGDAVVLLLFYDSADSTSPVDTAQLRLASPHKVTWPFLFLLNDVVLLQVGAADSL